ncbi:MAG TPA: hypothetical protein PKC21_06125 [Oligoflexia bacterium]|nr:hypothetical protein [Oligoflexia bacterium]HMR24912.1 hypothetical protein [Oligoflexia bacterium]
MYKEILGQIADFFSDERYQKEFSEAKKDYFDEAGKAFEDEPDYELKISGFLEWYLLDRILDEERETPAEHFAKAHQEVDMDKDFLQALLESQRSLFNIKNIKKYILEDLLYQPKAAYTLDQSCIEEKALLGLNKNQVIDARIFKYQDKVFIMDTIFAHSVEASSLIKKELKNNQHLVRKNISTVLDFAYMAHRRQQFSHVDIKEIYSLEKIKQLRDEIKSGKKN